eukprot:Gb_26709 [translate_table: standard]
MTAAQQGVVAQEVGGGGGQTRSSSSSSTAALPPPSSPSLIGPSPSTSVDALPRWQRQQQQEQQESLLQLRKSQGNGVSVHQGCEFQTSFRGGLMESPRGLSDGIPREHAQDGRPQSLETQAYLQCALQAAQQKASQEIFANNLKLQELMQLDARSSMFSMSPAQYLQAGMHMDQVQGGSNGKHIQSRHIYMAQLPGNNIENGAQELHGQHHLQNNLHHPAHKVRASLTQSTDIPLSAHTHLAHQILPNIQASQGAMLNVSDSKLSVQKGHMLSERPNITCPSAIQNYVNVCNGKTMVEGHVVDAALHSNPRQVGTIESLTIQGNPTVVNPNAPQMQCSVAGDYHIERVGLANDRLQNASGDTMTTLHAHPSSSARTPMGDVSFEKGVHTTPETSHTQHSRQSEQLHKSPSHLTCSNRGTISSHAIVSQSNQPVQLHRQRYGFTKEQLHVLKAQIMAYKCLKSKERPLQESIFRSIGPPPLSQQQEHVLHTILPNQPSSQNSTEQMGGPNTGNAQLCMPSNRGQIVPNVQRDAESLSMNEERKHMSNSFTGMTFTEKGSVPMTVCEKEERPGTSQVRMQNKDRKVIHSDNFVRNGCTFDRSKSSAVFPGQVKKHVGSCSGPLAINANALRKYHGPLFDIPLFGKKEHPFVPNSSSTDNRGRPLSLGYDLKNLLFEQGVQVLNKRRMDQKRKVEHLLSMKLDRKQIRPEFVLKLKIEQRKLSLLDHQKKLRAEVEKQQQDIMAMADRPYRKFVRLCERQRTELARQVISSQRAIRERQLKEIFQARKKFLDRSWASKNARAIRNRGVAKYHERMLKEYSKKKDVDRNKRMEALKNNDVDMYREMLEQQSQMPGDAGERYKVLSSFLSQTEEYLHKLGGKITAVKNNQEVEEAEIAAASAARLQGLSEEEVERVATFAGQEVTNKNCFSQMSPFRDNVSVKGYYNLAHAVNERITRQPSMLAAGTLRDYQLVGLQWMLSLYNNKLNGILADEMGLGKTVQVMALIAHLMEFKGNYGPHLIIVPNAVIVNWKSELQRWLPALSCIFYVGGKDQRMKLYAQEVCSLKFNVLVTTYEFIMRDRAKLSKVDWKYLIIDEAQRMKDRQSRLSRDLDRFQCQRRLLLTGTPLQNDLQELWSLLNLLLPEVFDNHKAFNDWFSKPFQKDGPAQIPEDVWLETEKKVIVIHRLHQILEPFMLRRRVEDVEGQLPQKVSVVLRCKLSALQAAVYDWIKSTGTIRLDPESEAKRVAGNEKRQVRAYAPLQNKCMELRKVCNHPFLNYNLNDQYPNEYIVRSCGKLWVLDRILIKLHYTGHRVLLFSTMTKLLDILEDYLQWRCLQYRRLDGSTGLDDRESAIVDFNKPGSECFIFLLSVRAAGRGLNLQSADTVVIYDPDANPKNEEQAVARAHRIGQKKEVKVIYMEAVVEAISSYHIEDELRSGGTIDVEDELAGKDRYVGSVESLVRNNIQQLKIDMADEVINAGRFDQRTTQEERRMTLEALLRDEERYQETVHDVPSMQEVNRLIARNEEEVGLFDQMDEEWDWPGEMLKFNEIPKWLRVGSREVNAAVAAMSKQASKRVSVKPIGTKAEEDKMLAMSAQAIPIKKPSNLIHSSNNRPSKTCFSKLQVPSKGRNCQVINDEEQNDLEASVEGLDAFYAADGDGEAREYLDEEQDGETDLEENDGDQLEEEEQRQCCRDEDYASGGTEHIGMVYEEDIEQRENASSESLSQYSKVDGVCESSPSVASQKFGSLAALKAKPATQSQPMGEEPEEGEIAASSYLQMDFQQYEYLMQESGDDAKNHVLQQKTKRKRSALSCRRWASAKLRPHFYGIFDPCLNWQNNDYDEQMGCPCDQDASTTNEPFCDKSDQYVVCVKRRRLVEPRAQESLLAVSSVSQSHCMVKNNRFNGFPEHTESPICPYGGSPDSPEMILDSGLKPTRNLEKEMDAFYLQTISAVFRNCACKHVLTQMLDSVNKDGRQIATLLKELPQSNENPDYYRIISNPIDALTITRRLDCHEYAHVQDFAADVHLMLENTIQYHSNSPEIEADARKLLAIFFKTLGNAFPVVDFSCLKSQIVSPSQSIPFSGPCCKQHSNPGELAKQQEAENLVAVPGLPKHSTRNYLIGKDEDREKGSWKENVPKIPPKEMKVRFSGQAMNREREKVDEVGVVPHAGDLGICKGKRKDREKGRARARILCEVPDFCQGMEDFNLRETVAPNQVRQYHEQPAQFDSLGKSGASEHEAVMQVQWPSHAKRLRTKIAKRRYGHK